MTERGRRAVERGPDHLAIGPSRLTWRDDVLEARIAEFGAPLPFPVRGVVRVRPRAWSRQTFALDAAGNHRWRPLAARADVEVAFDEPAVAWRGEGYLDTNAGDEPLQHGFRGWHWSRAHRRRDTAIFYDAERRDGTRIGLGLAIDADGAVRETPAPPVRALAGTGWRIDRRLRADAAAPLSAGRILEDTPFYARTTVHGAIGGEPSQIVHETLSLDRFRSPVVRAMLPFRMPRLVR